MQEVLGGIMYLHPPSAPRRWGPRFRNKSAEFQSGQGAQVITEGGKGGRASKKLQNDGEI